MRDKNGRFAPKPPESLPELSNREPAPQTAQQCFRAREAEAIRLARRDQAVARDRAKRRWCF